MSGCHGKISRARRGGRPVPTLWLMTDERVPAEALLRSADALPPGAGIVLRHYSLPSDERRRLFAALRAIARRRRLTLLLAGPAREAVRWGADGWHGHEARRRASARLLHSAPAHDAREVNAARRGGARILFLSPLFPTRSHPGTRTLGPARFALLARRARGMAVMALGGMTARKARHARTLGAQGWGAIDGLAR
jgi:thiamine-phosphate pyrophosphorylase